MTARQCDRCGALYSDNINDYTDTKEARLDVVKDCHPYPEIRLDLCDKCKKSLYNWLYKQSRGRASLE